MSDIDLATALNMFKEGAQQLSFRRALDAANDQVQQIKASDANEQQQRAQLQQLSNNLVTHMAGMGIPATTMQMVTGAIGPQHYANSNQMAAQAVLTGNDGLLDSASKLQEFEQNPEFKKELIQAKAEAGNPLKQAQFGALQDNRWASMQQNLDKRMDTQTTRFGNISKLQGANNRIQDAMTMLEGDINPQKLHELGRTFDSILSQGAATVEGSKSVVPATLKEKIANAQQYLTGKPANMNIDDFKQYYKDAFSRIQDVNNTIIKHAQGDVLKSAVGPAKFNPEGFETYAASRGLNAKVDRKTGKVSVDVSEDSTPAAPPAMTTVFVRDKTTGKIMKALKDANGRIYPANQ